MTHKENIVTKYLKYSKLSGKPIFIVTSTNVYEIFYEDDELFILESKKNSADQVGSYYNKTIKYKNIINKLKGIVKTVYTFENRNNIEYNFNKEAQKKNQIKTALLSLSKVLPHGTNLHTKMCKMAFPNKKTVPASIQKTKKKSA